MIEDKQDRAVRGFNSVNGTGQTQLIAAPDPRERLVINAVVIFNENATTGTGVELRSGSTKIWGPLPAPSGNAGSVNTIPIPSGLRLEPGEALTFVCLAGVATIHVSAAGYVVSA